LGATKRPTKETYIGDKETYKRDQKEEAEGEGVEQQKKCRHFTRKCRYFTRREQTTRAAVGYPLPTLIVRAEGADGTRSCRLFSGALQRDLQKRPT